MLISFLISRVGMLSLKKDKKEEEEKDGGNPYTHLEKTSVLQEARYGFIIHLKSRLNLAQLVTFFNCILKMNVGAKMS
jgi:hypothetical protein